MKKKEITNEDLAVLMNKGFEQSSKSTDKKIDNLAGMVMRGFKHVDKRFELMDQRFEKMEKRMKNLEIGQEDIKLRLDNTAYRFELKELQKRVSLLERKLKMA